MQKAKERNVSNIELLIHSGERCDNLYLQPRLFLAQPRHPSLQTLSQRICIANIRSVEYKLALRMLNQIKADTRSNNVNT